MPCFWCCTDQSSALRPQASFYVFSLLAMVGSKSKDDFRVRRPLVPEEEVQQEKHAKPEEEKTTMSSGEDVKAGFPKGPKYPTTGCTGLL